MNILAILICMILVFFAVFYIAGIILKDVYLGFVLKAVSVLLMSGFLVYYSCFYLAVIWFFTAMGFLFAGFVFERFTVAEYETVTELNEQIIPALLVSLSASAVIIFTAAGGESGNAVFCALDSGGFMRFLMSGYEAAFILIGSLFLTLAAGYAVLRKND